MDTPTFETGRPKMAADVVDAGALLRTTVFFTSFFLAVTVIKYVSGDYSGYQERGNLSDKTKYATKIFKKFSGGQNRGLIQDGRRRCGEPDAGVGNSPDQVRNGPSASRLFNLF